VNDHRNEYTRLTTYEREALSLRDCAALDALRGITEALERVAGLDEGAHLASSLDHCADELDRRIGPSVSRIADALEEVSS